MTFHEQKFKIYFELDLLAKRSPTRFKTKLIIGRYSGTMVKGLDSVTQGCLERSNSLHYIQNKEAGPLSTIVDNIANLTKKWQVRGVFKMYREF